MDFLDGKVAGVTPNLGKLASESLSFPAKRKSRGA
jgi:hypothetical protein